MDSDIVKEGRLAEERSIEEGEYSKVREVSAWNIAPRDGASSLPVGDGCVPRPKKPSKRQRSFPEVGNEKDGDREERCWERRVEEGGRVTGERSGE